MLRLRLSPLSACRWPGRTSNPPRSDSQVKLGRVTISGNLGDDLAPGTFDSILKQAGLKK